LEKQTPLEKRIKRHVIGRNHYFFVAVAPGLESLCLEELKSLPLTTTAFSMLNGGIEFEGRLQDCYLVNLHLRIANRVLMRIDGFKASNFSRLEKKLSSIPWELYFPRDIIPEINTSTKHSRLYHKDAIDERIRASVISRQALAEFYNAEGGPRTSFPRQLFVRVVDDLFTISLDSSGDLLYKRGLKEHSATAPIRETLAAAALMMAGFTGNEPLLDPMSGAGTFSIEAAMIATRTPPGFFRDFAFMDWPCFRSETWNHLRKISETRIIEPRSRLIAASEKDTRLCTALGSRIKNFTPLREIAVLNMDFFNMKKKDIMIIFDTDHPGLVIINPPYGVRLGTKRKSREIFRKIIEKLGADFKGWKYALFIHDRELVREVPFQKTPLLLDHGGLKLTLLTGRV
jgi:putative N6-adenine-specific DNA methylase